MSSILIKNVKEIITMDDKRNRLKGFSILIKDNKIAQIEKNIDFAADEIIDGSNYYLFPGLINTHHHFYQTLTRNLPDAQNVELFKWLEYLYPIWSNLSPEAVYYSTFIATAELLKTGCTTTVDQFYVFPKGQPAELLDEEFKAAKEIGIRFHGSRGSMSLSKDDGGLPPREVVQTEEEILNDSQRVIEKFHDDNPLAMQRVVLAPCSPFSVTGDLLKESIKLARSYGVESHTHLAETKDEEDFCQDKFGMRPLEYMESKGWLGNDVWYAHGVHLNEAEIYKMAETGTGIAHCPISNMKLSSGAANIPYMLKKDLPLALAVDGSASNDSSNMITEMRVALLLHKLVYGINSVSAEDILYIATKGGSRVLNQPAIGSIEIGKAADMFMVDSNRLGFAGGLHDAISALINTGDSQIVDYTIVNGKIVLKNGKLVNINEAELIEKANKISREMLS